MSRTPAPRPPQRPRIARDTERYVTYLGKPGGSASEVSWRWRGPPALPVASTATIGKPESVVAAELLLSHAAKHARLGAGDDADDINDDDDDSAAAVATNLRRPVSLETAATLAIFEKFE